MSSIKCVYAESMTPVSVEERAIDYVKRLNTTQEILNVILKHNPDTLVHLPELSELYQTPGSILDSLRPGRHRYSLGFTEKWSANGASKSHGGARSTVLGGLNIFKPTKEPPEQEFDLAALSQEFTGPLGSATCWWAGFEGSGIAEDWHGKIHRALGWLSLGLAEELYPTQKNGPQWLFLTKKEHGDPAEPFREIMQQTTDFGPFIRGLNGHYALFTATPEASELARKLCVVNMYGKLSLDLTSII